MLLYIFFLCFVPCVYSACVFPTDLRGQWRSTSNGLLTFTNITMSNYAASFTSDILSFTCKEISGSNYVVISEPYAVTKNINLYAYLCMQLEKLSSFKYLYTLGTTRDSTFGTRYYLSLSSNENASTVCTMTDTRTAGEYELLVLNTGGKFFCMYSLVSGGYTYLNLWNSDSSPNGVSTFTFTCMVLSKSDATVSATESPKVCQNQQTPTYVDSTGRYYTLTDTLYSTQSASENLAWVALLVVFGFIVVVAVIVAILISIFCIKKPLPITPPPSPLPIVKKRRKKIKRKEWNLVKIPLKRGRSRRTGIRTYTASSTQSRPSPYFSRYDIEFIREYAAGNRNRPPEYDTHSKESSQPPQWQVKWETDLKPSPRLEQSEIAPPEVEVSSNEAPHDTVLKNNKALPTRHVSFDEKPPEPPSRSDTILDDIGWLQPNERKNEPIYEQAHKMWPMLSKKNSKVWYINVEEKEKNPKS
ncbi:hypothetical protein ACJMK2_030853 [Sinanodonta woodiana]|uniref:Uncharacterized protein n=1 Tax=Sinanodonta woodiana TaxID=1069815 RepID=A0ABD3X0J1_SINWO